MLRKLVLGINNLRVETGALVKGLVYDAHQERVTGMPCIHSAGMQPATITHIHEDARILLLKCLHGIFFESSAHPWLPLPSSSALMRQWQL